MEELELIPHLFRTEYRKIVAVLCSSFGLNNIQFAEDMVSETFLLATETWGMKGIPISPKAWLYTVAKNKSKDQFRRNKLFEDKIKPKLKNKVDLSVEIEINLTEENITDSQLKMLFAVCNPIINKESQIALALRVLCGFGIEEISTAFMCKKETINKRLLRAKQQLRKHKIDISYPERDKLDERLNSVLAVIYLLFNEGYYSVSSEQNLNKDMCVEAMRLTYMLLEFEPTNLPKTNALMALLCFHSSRFMARRTLTGELILYDDQDTSNWDQELIAKGKHYLNGSADGIVTKYHLEAMISYWHTKKEDSSDKWNNILMYYNHLLQLEYSPMIALNRTYALSRANSKKEALKEALKIDLKGNHLYHALLAELYGNTYPTQQKLQLDLAILHVKTTSEKELLERKRKQLK